ncbi:MAG: hypothetical protein KAI03_05610 [Candidatus Aureabacteria bacterium]|nr:hypothetical protein [Candidatus Auribacterota bacterium]
MKVQSDFNKCIICKKEGENTYEHIIPDFIGGKLESDILCSNCNKTLGSFLVSNLKNDPDIRYSLEKVSDKIPKLYEKIRSHGLLYHTNGVDGKPLEVKTGKFRDRVMARTVNDGSKLFDTKDAEKIIQGMLSKLKLDNEKIEFHLNIFRNTDESKLIRFPGDIFAIKHPAGNVNVPKNLQTIDYRLPVLIAFEYLSICLLDKNIFHNYFDPIRDYIQGASLPEEIISAERLLSDYYNPFHNVYSKNVDDSLEIYIRFFRRLTFKVKFIYFPYKGKCPVYHEDIENRRSLIAKSYDDALKGVFYYMRARAKKRFGGEGG